MMKKPAFKKTLVVTVLFCGLGFSGAVAQMSQEELAKAAQNPLANVISLPFQNNTNFNLGPYDRTQDILNIQPVIPFFNGRLITRTIIPLIWQPEMAPSGTYFGLSDIQLTAFYSPVTKGFNIGVGPIIVFPAGSGSLGSHKWSAGPSLVILVIPGHWVIGLLANNIWSFAGNSDKSDINQMLVQYFINYNLPKGWFLSSAPTITANWMEAKENQWTVPFGITAGKLVKFGKLPVNLSVGGFYNAVKPDFASDWTVRVVASLMLPTTISKKDQ